MVDDDAVLVLEFLNHFIDNQQIRSIEFGSPQ